MLKVLIWQVSDERRYFDGALKTLERQHNGIEIVGITADAEISLVYEGRNVTFIPPDEVDGGGDYDIFLVVGARKGFAGNKLRQYMQLPVGLKIPQEKLLGDWLACIPGFTFEKYHRLKHTPISIFSINCFGGSLLNTMNLGFSTPFVNLYLSRGDFMKFLHKPQDYLKEPLIYKEDKYNANKSKFPVAMLGDITLYLLHYSNFESALSAWERRKKRIFWDNILVEMYSDDEKQLEEFDTLPYNKKVCFVPFKSERTSAWYIDPKLEGAASFKGQALRFSRGEIFLYDPFDMLLYGKKTPLIDM